jgi:hypothetical protein
MDRRRVRPPGRLDLPGPRFESILKPTGGTRWVTRLDPAGGAAYRDAVRPLVGRIERSLGPEVFAVRAGHVESGRRSPSWAVARAAWRSALRLAIGEAAPGTAFAVADVRDCYASIAPETIDALLGPAAAPAIAVLRHLHERGVRGLPVGPEPSAILANAALSRLDLVIRRAGVRHVRWVDDVALWGSREDVRRTLGALDAGAARLGLDLHHEKTRLLADRTEARAMLLGDRDSSIIAAP